MPASPQLSLPGYPCPSAGHVLEGRAPWSLAALFWPTPTLSSGSASLPAGTLLLCPLLRFVWVRLPIVQVRHSLSTSSTARLLPLASPVISSPCLKVLCLLSQDPRFLAVCRAGSEDRPWASSLNKILFRALFVHVTQVSFRASSEFSPPNILTEK